MKKKTEDNITKILEKLTSTEIKALRIRLENDSKHDKTSNYTKILDYYLGKTSTINKSNSITVQKTMFKEKLIDFVADIAKPSTKKRQLNRLFAIDELFARGLYNESYDLAEKLFEETKDSPFLITNIQALSTMGYIFQYKTSEVNISSFIKTYSKEASDILSQLSATLEIEAYYTESILMLNEDYYGRNKISVQRTKEVLDTKYFTIDRSMLNLNFQLFCKLQITTFYLNLLNANYISAYEAIKILWEKILINWDVVVKFSPEVILPTYTQIFIVLDLLKDKHSFEREFLNLQKIMEDQPFMSGISNLAVFNSVCLKYITFYKDQNTIYDNKVLEIEQFYINYNNQLNPNINLGLLSDLIIHYKINKKFDKAIKYLDIILNKTFETTSLQIKFTSRLLELQIYYNQFLFTQKHKIDIPYFKQLLKSFESVIYKTDKTKYYVDIEMCFIPFFRKINSSIFDKKQELYNLNMLQIEYEKLISNTEPYFINHEAYNGNSQWIKNCIEHLLK